MSQAPEKIYLQWFGDDEPTDLGEVSEFDVTWSKNKIFAHDIEYVRAEQLESEVTRLRKVLEKHRERGDLNQMDYARDNELYASMKEEK